MDVLALIIAFLAALIEALSLFVELKGEYEQKQISRERIRLKIRDLRWSIGDLEVRARELVDALHQADWQLLANDPRTGMLSEKIDVCMSHIRELEDWTVGDEKAKACFNPVGQVRGAASDFINGLKRACKRLVYKALGTMLTSLNSIHDCLDQCNKSEQSGESKTLSEEESGSKPKRQRPTEVRLIGPIRTGTEIRDFEQLKKEFYERKKKKEASEEPASPPVEPTKPEEDDDTYEIKIPAQPPSTGQQGLQRGRRW